MICNSLTSRVIPIILIVYENRNTEARWGTRGEKKTKSRERPITILFRTAHNVIIRRLRRPRRHGWLLITRHCARYIIPSDYCLVQVTQQLKRRPVYNEQSRRDRKSIVEHFSRQYGNSKHHKRLSEKHEHDTRIMCDLTIAKEVDGKKPFFGHTYLRALP